MTQKKNREELRQIMTDYRLNSEHVANLIHSSSTTVRIYCSLTGADISKANLELLKFKVGELKNVTVR